MHFSVYDTKPEGRAQTVPCLEAVRSLFEIQPGENPPIPIESCFRYHGQLVPCGQAHPLIEAASLCHNHHYPLVLSPDAIWLTIAQGFARHINLDPEQHRRRFVSHEGKKTLSVQRDDFVKGSPENPWADVFHEFSAKIREESGDAIHSLLSPCFSTTGPIESVAFAGVLMETLKNYFEYDFITLCGIPSVTLEGELEDWKAIRRRVDRFASFGLKPWTDRLAPILDEFIAAYQGRAHRLFWRCLYNLKINRESGVPEFVEGWILNFFPYLGDPPYPNRSMLETRSMLAMDENQAPRFQSHAEVEGLGMSEFPHPLSRTPFLWQCQGQSFPMEFLTGLVGLSQDAKSLAIRPEIGWAVREAPQ